jgi:hypothetical protein
LGKCRTGNSQNRAAGQEIQTFHSLRGILTTDLQKKRADCARAQDRSRARIIAPASGESRVREHIDDSAGVGGACFGEAVSRELGHWCYFAEISGFARILEKQNSLQMSQIFSRSRTSHSVVLLFKDSTAGPRKPKVLNSKTSSIRRHESKPKRNIAIGSGDLPGPLTSTNFGPAKARPLHHAATAPNPTLIPLNLAGLRCGLARLRPTRQVDGPRCRSC